MSQKPTSSKGPRREPNVPTERLVHEHSTESSGPREPVKKVAEPNKEELEKKIQGFELQIQNAKKKLAELDDSIKGAKSSSGEGRQNFGREIEKLKETSKDFHSKVDEAKQLRERLDAVEAKMNELSEKSKTAVRVSSEEEIDRKIKRLEEEITINSLSLNQEKKILSEISVLRASKKDLREQQLSQERLIQQREELRNTRKQIRQNLDQVNASISELKEQRAQQKALVDGISEKAKSEGGKIPVYIQEKDKLREVIKQSYSDIQAAKDVYYKQLNEFKDYERYTRDMLWEKRQREFEARNQERLEKDLERLETDAAIEPFVEEKTICVSLIKYIESRNPKAQEAAKPAPRSAPAAVPGLVRMQRSVTDHDNEWFSGAKKPAPKPAPKPAANPKAPQSAPAESSAKPAEKKEATLRIPLDVLGMFNKLGLETPTQLPQLLESVPVIQAKLDGFNARSGEEKARVRAEVDKKKAELIERAAAEKVAREESRAQRSNKKQGAASEKTDKAAEKAATSAPESAAPAIEFTVTVKETPAPQADE